MIELSSIAEPEEQLEPLISETMNPDLLAASDDLISTYHVAIESHRDSLDTKTIWVSLLKYTEKFAKYIDELAVIEKSEFETFRKSEKYKYIVSLNHIIESMIVRMIRSYEPTESSDIDLFLSHAGEQKEKTVKPLREAMAAFQCFFDSESLIAGDSISDEIRDALLTCNVGMVLISKEFVKKRWPLLELFILSARASLQKEDEFKLVVSTSCSAMEEEVFCSKGWDGWFDCVHNLPLPWPSDGMPVAMKLNEEDSSSDIQQLSEVLAGSVDSVRAKRRLKSVKKRFLSIVAVLLLSAILLFLRPAFGTQNHNPLMVGKFLVPKSLPYFQGRVRELNQLTEMMNDTSLAIIVPHGPGGVGKTQLVNSWVHEHEDEYGAIIWLRAEQEQTLISDLVSYAYATGLSSTNPADSETDTEIAKRVIRVIENEPGILLVYDNAESYKAVEKWLPNAGSACHTIITTRDGTGLDEGALLKIGPLDPDSAIRIVEFFVKRPIDERERDEILDIFETFDSLPLAIVAFSTQAHDLGIARAIRLFWDRHEEAFNQTLKLKPTFTGNHRESLWIVLRMQLESLTPEATVALEDLSVMNAERVPLSLLESLMRSMDYYEALKDLQSKAVIQFDVGDESVSTHRLLQDSAWDAMSETRRAEVLNGVGLELVNAMESVDMSAGRNETLTSVMPHAIAIVVRPWTTESDVLGYLCFKLGEANLYAGKHEEARTQLLKSLPILETSLGYEHRTVAETLNLLGTVFSHEGLYPKALEYYEKALPIMKASRGEKHQQVAQILNNMALVYYKQGLYDKALDLYEQAVSIQEVSLGNEHPDVAATMSNIAMVYEKKGLYNQSLQFYNQALSIQRDSLGEDHPAVATTLSNMALMYSNQGLYDDALKLYEQALSIVQDSFGDKHPNAVTAMNNIATTYVKKGLYIEALEMYKRVLSLAEESFGSNSPDVATILNNMGSLYSKQGLYDEALNMYEQVLSTLNATLGESHPNVGMVLNNMASIHSDQKHYDMALALYSQGLSILKKSMGENNLEVATTLNNIAVLYEKQGKYDKALEINEHVLSILKESLGSDNPLVAATSNNLAVVYKEQGKYEKALELYEETLRIQNATLGSNHTEFATTLNNMAMARYSQGSYEEALELCQQALSIKRASLGNGHPDVAVTLDNMAMVYEKLGSHSKALECYEQSSSIKKKTLLGDGGPSLATA